MTKYKKNFDAWGEQKKRLHQSSQHGFYFHEREIWWCALGVNIGFEQDGKGKNFERPALILRIFNYHFLVVIPQTSQKKFGRYYYKNKHNGKEYYLVLSQVRAISGKRLLRKITTVKEKEFESIKRALYRIL